MYIISGSPLKAKMKLAPGMVIKDNIEYRTRNIE